MQPRLALAVLVAGIAFPSAALAAPGDPVPSFGTAGVADVRIGTTTLEQPLSAIVADGDRPIVVEPVAIHRRRGFLVTRRRADGSPDPSFGAAGVRVVDLARGDAEAITAARDGAGRIIVLAARQGPRGGETFLVRLTRAGRLDRSFDHDGLVRVRAIAPGERPLLLAARRDGRIAIAASTSTAGVALALVDLRGRAVAGFGRSGRVAVTTAGRATTPTDLAFAADGALVVATTVSGPGQQIDLVVERRRGDGRRDPAFGRRGTLRLHRAGGQVTGRLAVRDDGRIMVARSDPDGVRIVAYLPSGRLDRSFGSAGAILAIPAQISFGGQLVALPHGHVALLWSSFGGPPQLGVFDRRGIGATAPTSLGGLLVPRASGGLFLGSSSRATGTSHPQVSAATASAAPIASFGGGSSVDVRAGDDAIGAPVHVNATVPRPGGGVLVGGFIGDGGASSEIPVVVALRADGAVDTSVGASGLALPFGLFGAAGEVQALVPVSASAVAVIGGPPDGTLRFARLDPATLVGDPGYGVFGVASLSLRPNHPARVAGVIAGPDGSLRGAAATDADASHVFALRADGSPETAVGGGGVALVPTTVMSGVRAVASRGGGRLVLVGAGPFLGGVPTSARAVGIAADGRVDASFGTNGSTILPAAGGERVSAGAVRVLGGGGLLVAGSSSTARRATAERLFRLGPTGLPDIGFGTGGTVSLRALGASEGGGGIALLPARGGRIALVSERLSAGGVRLRLARLRSSGLPDRGFAPRDLDAGPTPFVGDVAAAVVSRDAAGDLLVGLGAEHAVLRLASP